MSSIIGLDGNPIPSSDGSGQISVGSIPEKGIIIIKLPDGKALAMPLATALQFSHDLNTKSLEVLFGMNEPIEDTRMGDLND